MAASGALTTKISIHAPREGSDITIDRICDDIVFISIHAPRQGSDILTMCLVERLSISIHAPREGSDEHEDAIHSYWEISIHAPREWSDYLSTGFYT